MKIITSILFGILLISISGCACRQNFGQPIEDLAIRTELINNSRPLHVNEATFRSIIRWAGREISLTEVVKVFPDKYSVVGVTDIGKTLYSARVNKDGTGQVYSNVLPVSNKWLLENLIAELLIPFKGPAQSSRLYKLPDERYALIDGNENTANEFIFNNSNQLIEYRRIDNCRLICTITFEWGHQILKTMYVNNFEKHYKITRENISIAP